MKRRRQWGGGTWRWLSCSDWVKAVLGADRVRGGVPTRGSLEGCACALGGLRVRGGRSAPLPSLPAQAFLTLHIAVRCSCFLTLSSSVAAAAEWAFSFRVIMAGYEYVSPEQLAGFDKYKYSALDTNPLSLYVMHPFWNTIVKVFPTWLAPNLITFSGFMLLVFNFLLLTYFDPDFYASAPGHKHVPDWVWIVVGILNFVAYTLDGVDGKQARRTNSSTPLGELFDHGLDSWACVYFVVTVYSIFGRGPTGVSVFVLYLLLWVVLFSFILSHWEKYNTGVLFLPWGYDISQVTISFVYIVTAVVGVEAWYEPFLFNFLYRDLFTAMIIGCALCVTLPMSLLNFYRSYKSNSLKHNSIYEAMVPFFSPCLLFTLSTVWILRSPSDILEMHPRIFYFMVGTAFANITCQLIVCQMSSTRCPTLNWLLLPLFLVVATVIVGTTTSRLESVLLYTLTAAFTLAHIHYGVQVVKQLSRHFQIYPFSLRKPNSD
uniref:Selenoprotein I n=2 Tax=Rattus norvegicus TaxID=10116 RepID=B4F7D7_RAT